MHPPHTGTYSYDAVGNQVARFGATVQYTARNKPQVFNDALGRSPGWLCLRPRRRPRQETSRTQETLYLHMYHLSSPDAADRRQRHSIDPEKVNVLCSSQGGSDVTMGQLADAASCTDQVGGWYYDDPYAPSTITLCPSTCAAVQSDQAAKVSVEFGCATKPAT